MLHIFDFLLSCFGMLVGKGGEHCQDCHVDCLYIVEDASNNLLHTGLHNGTDVGRFVVGEGILHHLAILLGSIREGGVLWLRGGGMLVSCQCFFDVSWY